jgi:MFS family permease
MRWIIASGALHNFNMYAIGGFLTPFVMRVHDKDVQFAGYVTMAVFGLAGVPGMILGGIWGDAILRRRRNGRMLLAAFAVALSVPLLYFALAQPRGEWLMFSLLFGFGCGLLYVYYATVYSTIQDVIEPSLRATAMALYFFAMYVFGGALGPTVIGRTSDYFAQSGASAEGVVLEGLDRAAHQKAIEPYRAQGLNTALYALPVMSLLLAGTLFAGARTVGRDVENLQRWMRDSAQDEPSKDKREKAVT